MRTLLLEFRVSGWVNSGMSAVLKLPLEEIAIGHRKRVVHTTHHRLAKTLPIILITTYL